MLCGKCGLLLTIDGYLRCGSVCAAQRPEGAVGCGNQFNPGCRNHWPLYFELLPEEQAEGRAPCVD